MSQCENIMFIQDEYKTKIVFSQAGIEIPCKNDADMDGRLVKSFRQNTVIGTTGLATCGALIFFAYDSDNKLIARAISHESMIFSDELNLPLKTTVQESCTCKMNHIKDRLNEFFASYKLKEKLHNIRVDIMLIGGAEYSSCTNSFVKRARNMTKTKAKMEYSKIQEELAAANVPFRVVAYIPYINKRKNDDETDSVQITIVGDKVHISTE